MLLSSIKYLFPNIQASDDVLPSGGKKRCYEFELHNVRTIETCGSRALLFVWQVSHHPPIGVGHGENEHWTYDIVSAPSTKFLGNSVEIYPVGEVVSIDDVR